MSRSNIKHLHRTLILLRQKISPLQKHACTQVRSRAVIVQPIVSDVREGGGITTGGCFGEVGDDAFCAGLDVFFPWWTGEAETVVGFCAGVDAEVEY